MKSNAREMEPLNEKRKNPRQGENQVLEDLENNMVILNKALLQLLHPTRKKIIVVYIIIQLAMVLPRMVIKVKVLLIVMSISMGKKSNLITLPQTTNSPHIIHILKIQLPHIHFNLKSQNQDKEMALEYLQVLLMMVTWIWKVTAKTKLGIHTILNLLPLTLILCLQKLYRNFFDRLLINVDKLNQGSDLFH
jgi:hypothetical protein